MTIALALLWWELPTYHPLKGGCAEGKICFGIYDIARPSFLALFSLYYICGSLFRVTVTGLYAALKHRYK
jgi:hypothetical protein